jgi:ribosomal protein S18 acetylase RimI-like enzyme
MDSADADTVPWVDRVEANFLGHLTWLHQATPGMRVFSAGNWVVADSGLPCDSFNTIFLTQPVSPSPSPEDEEEACQALRHFRSRALPFAVWLGGRAIDGGGALLGRLGLRHAETEPGMALELGPWVPAEEPSAIEVRPVVEPAGIGDFSAVLAAAADSPDPHVLEFYRRTSGTLLAPSSPMILSVGYVGGQPVATCEVFLGDGTAGLYGVATRRDHQRQGIGTAMVLAALAEAKRRGCDLATLLASPAGLPVYQRIGFRVCGVFHTYQEGRTEGP